MSLFQQISQSFQLIGHISYQLVKIVLLKIIEYSNMTLFGDTVPILLLETMSLSGITLNLISQREYLLVMTA